MLHVILHVILNIKCILLFSFMPHSKDLASIVLDQCNAASKDPNLYYVAMETQIEKKGK